MLKGHARCRSSGGKVEGIQVVIWSHDNFKIRCVIGVCLCVCRERDRNLSDLERQMLRENMNHGKEELLKVQNVCIMESPGEAQFFHFPAVDLNWTSCLIGMITPPSSCHSEMLVRECGRDSQIPLKNLLQCCIVQSKKRTKINTKTNNNNNKKPGEQSSGC